MRYAKAHLPQFSHHVQARIISSTQQSIHWMHCYHRNCFSLYIQPARARREYAPSSSAKAPYEFCLPMTIHQITVFQNESSDTIILVTTKQAYRVICVLLETTSKHRYMLGKAIAIPRNKSHFSKTWDISDLFQNGLVGT